MGYSITIIVEEIRIRGVDLVKHLEHLDLGPLQNESGEVSS